MSFFKRIFSTSKIDPSTNEEAKQTLDKGLEKSKVSFFSKLTKAVAGKSKVDDEVLDNLEEILVSSDVGVATTLKIIQRIEKRVPMTRLRQRIAERLLEAKNNTAMRMPCERR
jgi:fused signal recognition particle receptor